MRKGQYVRRNGVYVTFKDEMDDTGISSRGIVDVLSRYAVYYRQIHRPATVLDEIIRRKLTRLNYLSVSTSYPLILHLMDLNSHHRLSSEELANCLWALQSFAIRRLITGVSTRPYYRCSQWR